MKRLMLLSYVCILFVTQGFAQFKGQQGEQTSYRSPYLFEEFTFGTVLFKSGAKKGAEFNYNIVTEQMLFLKGEKVWALKTPGVDTIYVGGKKFIPMGEAYSEVLKTTVGVMYIKHHAEILDKGNPVGYGGYSQTSSSGSMSNTAIIGTFQALDAQPRFHLNSKSVYWVKSGLHLFEAQTLEHLQKAFPDKKKSIQKLAKEQATNFARPEEVVALLERLD